MYKLGLVFLFLLNGIWSITFGQTNDFNRVYEGSFGFFTDQIFTNKHIKYNSSRFIDFGIGKQNNKKRRLFHFNYKQTQSENSTYLYNYKAIGFDYTKTKKLFSFDKNGIFIGTSFSAEYINIIGKPKLDSLDGITYKNPFAAINFKIEYLHFINDHIQVNFGIRLNVVQAGWQYFKRNNPLLDVANIQSRPDFPTPLHFEKMNIYLGIGFNKLKSEDAK
jgi:hypothetical protein